MKLRTSGNKDEKAIQAIKTECSAQYLFRDERLARILIVSVESAKQRGSLSSTDTNVPGFL